MLQNATGGWVTTHDIRDELDLVNAGERIAEIRREGYTVERELIKIRGKRAARYRLARDAREEQRVVVDAAAPAESLFDTARPSQYFGEAA
jgi:hypothetical protein